MEPPPEVCIARTANRHIQMTAVRLTPEDRFPCLRGQLADRSIHGDAVAAVGVVDQDRQPAERLDRGTDQLLALLFNGEVSGDEGRRRSELAQVGGHPLAPPDVPPGDDHRCALLGEHPRHLATESPRGPGDESHLPGQSRTHVTPLDLLFLQNSKIRWTVA